MHPFYRKPLGMDRTLMTLGAASAFLAVALGAFAAHALKAILAPDLLGIFEVGVRYQMYHALGLIALGCVYERRPSKILSAAGWLFAIGTVLFSGSLYALATSGSRVFGMVTPIGGVAFLAGWTCFVGGVWRSRT